MEAHALAFSPAVKCLSQNAKQVLYDDVLHEVIVIQNGNNLQISPMYRGKPSLNILNIGNSDSQQFSFDERFDVVRVRRSIKRTYLAVGTSDKDVLVYNTTQRSGRDPTALTPLAQYSLGQAKRYIRDFYWVDDSALLIVTSFALELWKVNTDSRKPSLKRVGSFSTTVDSHAFYHSRGVSYFVCRNHAQGKRHAMKGFRIEPTGIFKIAKMFYDESASPRPENTQYSLAKICSTLYLVVLDTQRGELSAHPFNLKQECFDRRSGAVLDFQNGAPASYFMVVDNAIVVFSNAAKLSIVIDTKTVRPFLPPKPVGFKTYTPDQRPGNSAGPCLGVSAFPALYENTVLFGTEFLFHTPSCKVFKLQLNLHSILKTFQNQSQAMEFLLRQQRSKMLVLHYIKQLMRDQEKVATMATLFNQMNQAQLCQATQARKPVAPSSPMSRSSTLQSFSENILDYTSVENDNDTPRTPNTDKPASKGTRGLQSPREESGEGWMFAFGERFKTADVKELDRPIMRQTSTREVRSPVEDAFPEPEDVAVYADVPLFNDNTCWVTADGRQIIQQQEMYKEVFFPVNEDKACPAKYFNIIFVEYVRSLVGCQIPLQECLHRIIIDILVFSEPPSYHTLHQYLQYQVIEDQLPIALQLLSLENSYPPAFQLALDMLARLKSYDEIVEVMMSRGMVIKAVEVMIQYKVKRVPFHQVLEKAVEVGDEAFLCVYSLLAKHASALTGRSLADDPSCELYTSLFTEWFGEDAAERIRIAAQQEQG